MKDKLEIGLQEAIIGFTKADEYVKEKCDVCNREDSHHSMCPRNIINSDSYQYIETQK